MSRTRRFHTHTIVIITGCLSLAGIQSAHAIGGSPSWSIVTVHEVGPDYFASAPDLAFDHYGVPGISWSRVPAISGASTVLYSRPTALGLWAHHELASGAGVGLRTALAYDRAERPVVAWNNSDGTLKARYNLASTQQIATGIDANKPNVSIHFDAAGELQGVFTKPSAAFHGISHDGQSFGTSPLFTPAAAGAIIGANIVTDHMGYRHLIAAEQFGGADDAVLIASESAAGVWIYDRSTTADAVNGVDIATNPVTGGVGFAYTTFESATGESKLFYSAFNGITLETTEIFSSIDMSFEDLSLALDPTDGRPAIAYERFSVAPYANAVRLAYLDESLVWQDSLIDDTVSLTAPGSRARKPSLAFDDYGTSWPAVAYIDEDESLNIAFDPPGAAPEPATAVLLIASFAILRRRSVPKQRSRR